MNANPMFINLTGKESTIEKAIINVLNIVSNEMFNGRVSQAQADIKNEAEKEEQDILQLQADVVEAVIDEYNALIE